MVLRRSTLGCALLVALLCGLTAQASPPDLRQEPLELLVLLAPAPAAPTAEELVAAVRGDGMPADLPGGTSPTRSRLLLPESARLQGEARAALHADPDRPRARLERYVVLEYPAVVDLERLIERLEMDPKVEWVGRNAVATLSAVPNDTFYDGTFPAMQWGSPTLGLEAVWDYQPGHAYVGIIDTGIDTDHPDLRGQYHFGTHQWAGGAFRPHLSYDWAYNDTNVDEGESEVPIGGSTSSTPHHAGHGSHVAGIVAATENNSQGVAGACWDCSLMIHKGSRLRTLFSGVVKNDVIQASDAAAAIVGAVDAGAQVLNLSFGYRPPGEPGSSPNQQHATCSQAPTSAICQALDYAVERDVVVVAASGNVSSGGWAVADFPAQGGPTIAAGGLNPSETFWTGSHELVTQYLTPANSVLSTFYIGKPYEPNLSCDDSVLAPSNDGYGPCTGTSMAAPYLSAVVAAVRSTNPWLSRNQIGTLLMWNVRLPVNWSNSQGRGIPEADELLFDALGRVDGQVIPNRLTPLFSLYSSVYEDWFYTTFPQWGSTARDRLYVSTGPDVAGYGDFPGTECWSVSCPEARASVFVFTGTAAPFLGAPALKPLYRMSSFTPLTTDRDTAFATDSTGVLTLAAQGLQVDGVEGYLYAPCTPEPSCIPDGATKLLQRYNPTRNDHAVFPENELATMQAAGYTQVVGPGVLGYAYPHVDSDGDDLIDGFEGLLGTSASLTDSDCDGEGDGDEVLDWGTIGYGDPLDGTCP